MPAQQSPSGDIPIIETQRLRMRAFEVDDLEAYTAMWSDPFVLEHIHIEPSSREQTWTRLLRAHGHWAVMGFGFWAVEETATGRFVGEVGLAEFMRDIEPSLVGTPEIGWVLAPWCYGKGYATEAARAAIDWFDSNRSGERTACIISPENRASLRVADKCGYREFARTTYQGRPTIVLGRPAP